MNNFFFHTPTQVYFGKDEELKVGQLVKEYDPKKVLIHFGGKSAKASGLLDRVKGCLEAEGIAYVELGGVKANPELSLVKEGIALCLKEGVDFVLAVGGGSVLDSAKAICHGAAVPEVDEWDYHCGKAKPTKSLHKGCILTLAAAGSEMSNSCVITNEATGEKRGVVTPLNRMDFAIMNPELTFTVSPYQTACGAVDIAMHTIERYFCKGEDTYLTDAIAEAIVKSTMKAGNDCLKDPCNYEARANMMWASSLAHNTLTQCGRVFGLPVHQFEHEISGLYPQVAHGAGLAALWCSWARYVYKADLNRFLQFAANVWNMDIDFEHPEKTVEEMIDKQEAYYASIGMPTNLQMLGVKEEDLEPMALACSKNKTRVLDCAIPLGYEEMLDIYKMAFNA